MLNTLRAIGEFGMVRLLGVLCALIGISGAALAADLPPRPAPVPYVPAAAPVYNWTGFYIGDNLGDSWSNSQRAVFAGGGQVGANYQFNWLVVGVEADFDWLANNSNSTNAVFVPGVG